MCPYLRIFVSSAGIQIPWNLPPPGLKIQGGVPILARVSRGRRDGLARDGVSAATSIFAARIATLVAFFPVATAARRGNRQRVWGEAEGGAATRSSDREFQAPLYSCTRSLRRTCDLTCVGPGVVHGHRLTKYRGTEGVSVVCVPFPSYTITGSA